MRSKRSTISNASGAIASYNDSDEDHSSPTTSRRKSDAGNKAISRPTSRASRKRSDSNATRKRADSNGTAGAPETPKADKASKRMSVAGWASSAMSSVTGKGKKDRDNFATLTNDDEDGPETINTNSPRPPSSRSFSRKSPMSKARDLPNGSPRTPNQIMKLPSQHERKLVRALHDFTGSSDELTFKVGDEITVIHEVLDDWWLGALSDGRKGLFPVTYTETISRSPSSYQGSVQSSEDDLRRSTMAEDSDDDIGNLLRGRAMDSDTSHPSSARFGYGFDAESIASTVPEDEEETRLVPIRVIEEEVFYNPPSSSPHPLPPSISSTRSNSDMKRAPPLPPPRRPSNSPTAPPPLPNRNPIKNQSQANSPVPPTSAYLTPSSSVSSVRGPDVSPFDSLLDVTT